MWSLCVTLTCKNSATKSTAAGGTTARLLPELGHPPGTVFMDVCLFLFTMSENSQHNKELYLAMKKNISFLSNSGWRC